MTDKEKKSDQTEDQDDIVAVTDEDLAQRAEEEQKKATAAKDQDDDDDDDDDGEDARVGASEEDDEDGDSPKKRERERRKRRNQRKREARERLERENRFYDQRNQALEKRVIQLERQLVGTQRLTLDGRISQLTAAIKRAEDVMADATTAGRGEEAVEAQKLRDQFKEDLQRLQAAQARTLRLEEEDDDDDDVPSAGQRSAPAPDPRVVTKARSWVQKNQWYDPLRRDPDSQMVGMIDDSLIREGYDPATDDYWEELNDRVREQLPHLARGRKRSEAGVEDEDLETGEDRRSAKNGSGGPKFRSGAQRSLKKGEFYLSPERVEALKEAGVWDDPEQRKKFIRRYQKFDSENAQ